MSKRPVFSLEGRVALVTGGSGKLGIEHARALKGAGARVWSIDTVSPRDGIYDGLTLADITVRGDVARAITSVAEKEGRIDILVNNAAYTPPKSAWKFFTEYSIHEWNNDLAVQLTGSFNATCEAYRHMEKAGYGRIIFISSTSGVTATNNAKYPEGMYKYISYFPGKHGVIGLARAIASQIAKRQHEVGRTLDITANVLAPGAVDFNAFAETNLGSSFAEKLAERNMLGRPARPDEYAGGLVFLAGEESAFMTGHTFVMDGGQTVW